MPAWKAARNAGQSARMSQIKERSDPHIKLSAGYYDFDEGRCFFCRSKNAPQKRTAFLPVTGKIWTCKNCRDAGKLEEEKKYERTL